MITVEAAQAAYADALRDTLTITRLTGTGGNQSSFSAENVRCRILHYGASEIGGAIVQGDQKIIILKADLVAKQWNDPPRRDDRITLGGRTMVVIDVDQNTRKVASTIIAYVVRARGT